MNTTKSDRECYILRSNLYLLIVGTMLFVFMAFHIGYRYCSYQARNEQTVVNAIAELNTKLDDISKVLSPDVTQIWLFTEEGCEKVSE